MKLLTISIVAQRLGVSAETVYQLGRNKNLKVVKVGPKKGFRISEKELLRFISENFLL